MHSSRVLEVGRRPVVAEKGEPTQGTHRDRQQAGTESGLNQESSSLGG